MIFSRLEEFYDAVPRAHATAETHGNLVLFVRDNTPGYPYYARPVLGAPCPSAEDLATVRQRQQELGIPEAFEWVHETTPGLLEIAEAGGLHVLQAPLLVLDPDRLPEPDGRVRILDPHHPGFADDLAARHAVAHVGFSNPGTATGDAGAAERDNHLQPLSETDLAAAATRHLHGEIVSAVIDSPDGPIASGILQRVGTVAEIAGVATLPTARRQGLAAAITTNLAHHARNHGVEIVLLSAGSEDIARVYHKAGFTRIGTACIAEPR